MGIQICIGISSHQHIVAAVFIRTVALLSPTDYSIIIVAAVIVDGWFISGSSVVLVPDISFSFDGFPILHSSCRAIPMCLHNEFTRLTCRPLVRVPGFSRCKFNARRALQVLVTGSRWP